MATEGTACPAGSVQVADYAECWGAAFAFLEDAGSTTNRRMMHSENNAVDVSTHVPGCFEPVNEHKLQFNNNPTSTGTQGKRVCRNTTSMHMFGDSKGVGCIADLSWYARVCPGCSCVDSEGDATSLTDYRVEFKLNLTNTEATASECSSWFVTLDSILRGYMARLISMVAAKKTACCTPWATSEIVKDKSTGTPGITAPVGTGWTHRQYFTVDGYYDLGKLDPMWQAKPTLTLCKP